MNQRRMSGTPALEPDDELVAALAAVEAFLVEEQAALTQAPTYAPALEVRPSWQASAKLAAIGLRPARVPPPRWHTIERYRRAWSGMTGVIGL
ncbi:hypothetical protein [Kallotenue papyrolyticum]|uniref:hypothetical protein n=1 Tax=Kallotenue papyrolyticum TaxID=1325125 RepID=UPI0004BC62B8|nr:hypothetical protein [Kallotenue papyrolyticum]